MFFFDFARFGLNYKYVKRKQIDLALTSKGGFDHEDYS